MIAALRGKIIEREFTRIVIDVNAVGYEVFIPMSTYDQLPMDDSEVSLRIHTVVREDAIILFGFITFAEKNLFMLLNTVSGIGPKLALNILSALPVAHTCNFIAECNIAALSKINGLGKKTAERLTVELRDKVRSIVCENSSASDKVTKEKIGNEAEDAISALLTLGFKDAVARKAILSLIDELPEKEQIAEVFIRKALQRMNS